MSGIVGIINTDGATLQPAMLERLVETIIYRGPDGRHTWLKENCGLGHTLLRTTNDQPRERQPSSLDGEVWISADARVDARRELLKNLREHGRVPSIDATDAELLLHAYHAWGRECLKYLIGDFAFIIWDARTREPLLRTRPFRHQALLLRANPRCSHPQQHSRLHTLAPFGLGRIQQSSYR